MSKGYPMIQTSELGGPESFLARLAQENYLHHLKQHIFTVPTLKQSMRDYELGNYFFFKKKKTTFI
jgi:hypothetical protein